MTCDYCENDATGRIVKSKKLFSLGPFIVQREQATYHVCPDHLAETITDTATGDGNE